VVRWLQRLLEPGLMSFAEDHPTRDPVPILLDLGFTVQRQQRFKAGIIQRVTATTRRT
jgi:hypothetical protein